MPLTKTGTKVLKKTQGTYGLRKGKSVFYASMNAKKLDRNKMEGHREVK